MAAEQKKAPNTDKEPPKSDPSGVSGSDHPVGPDDDAVADRLAGLDVRAQSALLQEAFQTPDPIEHETPSATPSPQRGSLFSRYGWRGVKSALGLLVVVIAGVGPVQRLLEFSSIEAVVNARLISLRAPIDGRIEDFAPTIGTSVPKGRLMLHISNSRADRARLDDLSGWSNKPKASAPPSSSVSPA
jgi:hypothetical protein